MTGGEQRQPPASPAGPYALPSQGEAAAAQPLLAAADQHRSRGHFSEALACYQAALAQNPGAGAEAHFGLGATLAELGDHPGAIAAYVRAVELRASYTEAYRGLGESAAALGQYGGAVDLLLKAAALNPACALTYAALAHAEHARGNQAQGSHYTALAHAARSTAADPSRAGEPNAWYLLGCEAVRLKSNDHAYTLLARAVAQEPTHSHALRMLGALEEDRGLLDQAEASFRAAIRHGDPAASSTAKARVSLARVLSRKGDADAISVLEREVHTQTCSDETRFALGIALLLHGRYREAWQYYECRTGTLGYREFHNRSFAAPEWDGSPLQGRTILLHAEQGLGDTLQFARYAPLVAARGGRVLLEVQPELRSALAGLPGVIACLARPLGPEWRFDLQARLLSLPRLFATELNSIPVPLLPEHLTEGATPRAPGLLRVGLVWAGNSSHLYDRLRSIELSQLAPLATIPGVEFTSLQRGQPAAQGWSFAGNCDGAKDFRDTAAIVRKLDLVIAVDTAVAHLAASMGRPVWLLISHMPDWRWGLSGTATPWYPSVRIFRQQRPHAWEEVVEEVARELRSLCARGCSSQAG